MNETTNMQAVPAMAAAEGKTFHGFKEYTVEKLDRRGMFSSCRRSSEQSELKNSNMHSVLISSIRSHLILNGDEKDITSAARCRNVLRNCGDRGEQSAEM